MKALGAAFILGWNGETWVGFWYLPPPLPVLGPTMFALLQDHFLASVNAACKSSPQILPKQQKYSWKRKVMENRAAEKPAGTQNGSICSQLRSCSAVTLSKALNLPPAPPNGYWSVKNGCNPNCYQKHGAIFHSCHCSSVQPMFLPQSLQI